MDQHEHHHATIADGTTGLWDSLGHFFSESGFMPHGHCYLWKPALVWTHVVSDILIGLAYVSISLSLYALIKKIRLPFSAMVLSFGVFIGACGATHFMEVWNLWWADYWAAGLVKALTALASVATGIWLIRVKPQIIALAETAKLSEQRRHLIEKANEELQLKTIELAKTNRILEEQKKALAHTARMSALGEMAGGIAHEINSPLGIITLHAQQIERMQKRNALTPEKIMAETQLIAATAKRIGDIINGLRTFARDGEKDPFELTRASNIFRDVLILCQSRLEGQEIELRLVSAAEDIEIECRPVQIGQVLLNLINNASDAIQNLPVKWISIEVIDRENMVDICVTDSGHGIDPDLAPKLMQPFFTTKEVGKGTGLGLSISKGIAESHRGDLFLDVAAANTRFVLRLPKLAEKGI